VTTPAALTERQTGRAEALAFYERVQPLVERLAVLARQWHEAAGAEDLPAAIEAHNEFLALAIRTDLRLNRLRRTPCP
jgi:hypothetical protein